MKILSVEELQKAMETDDQDSIMEIARMIESSAVQVLKEKDKEYLRTMVSLIEAMTATALIQTNPKAALMLVSLVQDDDFLEIMVFVIKYTLGLAVIEELH